MEVKYCPGCPPAQFAAATRRCPITPSSHSTLPVHTTPFKRPSWSPLTAPYPALLFFSRALLGTTYVSFTSPLSMAPARGLHEGRELVRSTMDRAQHRVCVQYTDVQRMPRVLAQFGCFHVVCFDSFTKLECDVTQQTTVRCSVHPFNKSETAGSSLLRHKLHQLPSCTDEHKVLGWHQQNTDTNFGLVDLSSFLFGILN